MLVAMKYDSATGRHYSEMDAADVIDAFLSGDHVVMHFEDDGYGVYASVVIASYAMSQDAVVTSWGNLSIDDDGKLVHIHQA